MDGPFLSVLSFLLSPIHISIGSFSPFFLFFFMTLTYFYHTKTKLLFLYIRVLINPLVILFSTQPSPPLHFPLFPPLTQSFMTRPSAFPSPLPVSAGPTWRIENKLEIIIAGAKTKKSNFEPAIILALRRKMLLSRLRDFFFFFSFLRH